MEDAAAQVHCIIVQRQRIERLEPSDAAAALERLAPERQRKIRRIHIAERDDGMLAAPGQGCGESQDHPGHTPHPRAHVKAEYWTPPRQRRKSPLLRLSRHSLAAPIREEVQCACS